MKWSRTLSPVAFASCEYPPIEFRNGRPRQFRVNSADSPPEQTLLSPCSCKDAQVVGPRKSKLEVRRLELTRTAQRFVSVAGMQSAIGAFRPFTGGKDTSENSPAIESETLSSVFRSRLSTHGVMRPGCIWTRPLRHPDREFLTI